MRQVMPLFTWGVRGGIEELIDNALNAVVGEAAKKAMLVCWTGRFDEEILGKSSNLIYAPPLACLRRCLGGSQRPGGRLCGWSSLTAKSPR